MTRILEGFQYQLDHTECVIQIIRKLDKGAQAKFLLDKTNFFQSSCARQAPRVKELFEAGCEFRVVKPLGGFACMHAKTLIVDRITLLAGSVNLTHHGFESNKEHLSV